MNKASSLWLALLSSCLPACVSTPHDPVQPLVSMNVGIQINPDSEYLRGKLLHLQARYDEAQQAYLSALTMDKHHAEARNGLAALFGARGDLDRSIALLSNMVQSDSRLPHVYINLSHAWVKKGQLVQARAALERALALDPENLVAQEKMAELLLLEKPSLTQVNQTTVAADSDVSVISVNPVERLSDGMYVLRYSVPVSEPAPVSESAPQTVQMPAEAVLNTAASHVTEPAIGIGAPVARSDFHEDSEPQRTIPTLAIEVANGNGVQGLARSLRGLLDGQSWRVVRTVNHEQFGVRFTRIEYAANLAQEAKNLADTLGIDAKLRVNNQQTGTQMRIILGHDLKDLSAIRQRLAAAAQSTRTSSAIPAKSYRPKSLN